MQASRTPALQRTDGAIVTRPFLVVECAQRSPEWLSARVGRVTGSRAPAVFGKTQAGKPRADRRNLITQLVCERLTGQPQERPVSGYQVRDGIAREPLARFRYECITGTLLRTCGFVSDNELPIGCSPDAFLGDFEGLVSVKCPTATTHLKTLLDYRQWERERDSISDDDTEAAIAKRLAFALSKGHLECIDPDYRYQMAHEMYCTGASWCDFMSYSPDLPDRLQAVIIRVARTDFDFVWYETQIREFLSEVDAEMERVIAI